MIICFNYSRLNINIISVIIAIFFVILANIKFSSSNLYFDIVPSNIQYENSNIQIINENILINKQDNFYQEWLIEIPKINLLANISEGTTQENLNKYVCHFSETDMFDGNVGLAAHNRGYDVNYFSRIKELEKGDEIIYKYNGKTKKYLVNEHQIIKETDWSYLKETTDNRITLITCVEDMPEYRRCIQAKEKREE